MCYLPLISFQSDLRSQGNSSQATLAAHITCQTYRPKRRKEPLRESKISKWKDELMNGPRLATGKQQFPTTQNVRLVL